jgi:glyoxylase-like metal-dependent hydrolase (beta-lactamase superfamily II)
MSKEYAVPTWESGVKQLAPNVYAYVQAKATWYWSNAGFIVGSDYVVVVDSLSTVGLTQRFKDEIKKITDKPIRYLINTHHHGDHTYGNHVFAGAIVISHDYCRREVIGHRGHAGRHYLRQAAYTVYGWARGPAPALWGRPHRR